MAQNPKPINRVATGALNLPTQRRMTQHPHARKKELPQDALTGERFAVLEKWSHFATCAGAPLSEGVLDVVSEWERERVTCGATEVDIDKLEEARGEAAILLGCHAGEICFAPTLQQALQIGMDILKTQPSPATLGDIVASPLENSACLAVLSKYRTPTYLKPDPHGAVLAKSYFAGLTERPNAHHVVFSSLVFNATGYRQDVTALGKLKATIKPAARIVVDGSEVVGAFACNVKASEVDVLVCSGHKWLMGPVGAAFVFVDAALLARSSSRVAHLFAQRDSSAVVPPMWSAEHMPSVAPVLALRHSMRTLTAVTIERVEARVVHLNRYLTARLKEQGLLSISPLRDESMRSGITVLLCAPGMAERLLKRNIIVAERKDGIQICTGYFCTHDHVDLVVDTLVALVNEERSAHSAPLLKRRTDIIQQASVPNQIATKPGGTGSKSP
jgi:selenocysteine lyase/cysteine desulfurase